MKGSKEKYEIGSASILTGLVLFQEVLRHMWPPNSLKLNTILLKS